jgi:hypothetical protein
MTRHRDALTFALFGFVLATLVQLPAILDAYAARSARDAAYALEYSQ